MYTQPGDVHTYIHTYPKALALPNEGFVYTEFKGRTLLHLFSTELQRNIYQRSVMDFFFNFHKTRELCQENAINLLLQAIHSTCVCLENQQNSIKENVL